MDIATMKSKTLHDFFLPDPDRKAMACVVKEADARELASVPGLTILSDFIKPNEEMSILAFLEHQKWRTDLQRRSIHYGGTYCLMPPRHCTPEQRKRIEDTIIKAEPIPDELSWLVDRMVENQLYPGSARPEFCIVNEYTGARGISAHVENFRFAEPVCGLTLEKGDFMRFYELERPDDGSVRSGKASKAPRTGRKFDVWLPPRSLVVLQGDAREKWQHEITRRKRSAEASWRRVSLTFRVEKSKS